MKTTSKRLTIVASVTLLGLAPAALAQDASITPRSDDLPSIRVNYADLNVESEAGMQTLTRRVSNAVRRVCSQSFGTSTIEQLDGLAECRRTARNGAWVQFERNQERARAARGTLIAGTPSRVRDY